MSRSLRAVRLAAGRLATFFNKLLVAQVLPSTKPGLCETRSLVLG